MPSVSGEPVRKPKSGQRRRSHRRVPEIHAADVERADRRRPARLRALAAGAGAAPRGAPVPRRAADCRTQGGARARHDARDGEGPRRDARRRAGSDRHDVLHGGRRPPSVRPDRAVRAARQVRDVDPAAARRLRGDHAVEFSDGDPVVEDHPGARLRQHGRVQAGDADAALGASTSSRSSKRPAFRQASSTWSPAAAAKSATRCSPATTCAWCRSPARPTSAARCPSSAAPSFKKVHLEMGGKNVIMVMDDANLELAVEGCLWGGFGTTGQRCTAASRVVVHEKVYDAVPRRVSSRGRARFASATASIPRRRWGRRSARASSRPVMKYVEIGAAGGRPARVRRPRAHDRRVREGLLPRADDLCRRRAVDADRAGGDLRPGRVGDSVPLVRGSGRDRQRRRSTGCRRRSTRRT